jgi:hypothetical protein
MIIKVKIFIREKGKESKKGSNLLPTLKISPRKIESEQKV